MACYIYRNVIYMDIRNDQVACRLQMQPFDPFHTTRLFLRPLKISENRWFSDVFRGYRKRLELLNGLTH